MNNKDVTNCPVDDCNRPRYKKNGQAMALRSAGFDLNDGSILSLEPVQKLPMVSVGASLAKLLLNDDKKVLFEYRSTMAPIIEEDRVYRDVYDGEVFQNWLNEGNIFKSSNDIALLVFVDGFEPKYVNDHTMTIVHCLVMSIDPSHR
ncbi:hypothetical protein G6F56_012826 [Rhizopus delemar]|nr:hypothetical protein G6F56_012826 [Rhizopus delemar]